MPNIYPITVADTGECAHKQQDSTFQYYFRGTVVLNSQDPVAKTSNLTFTWQMYCKSSGTTKWSGVSASNRPYGYITANANAQGGVRLVTGSGLASYTTSTTPITLATYTGDFQHDDQGNLSIRTSFGWKAGGGSVVSKRPADFNEVVESSGIYPLANSLKIKTADGWVGDTTFIKTADGWQQAIAVYIKTADGWQQGI